MRVLKRAEREFGLPARFGASLHTMPRPQPSTQRTHETGASVNGSLSQTGAWTDQPGASVADGSAKIFTTTDAQLRVATVQVTFHSANRDHEFFGDLAIRET